MPEQVHSADVIDLRAGSRIEKVVDEGVEHAFCRGDAVLLEWSKSGESSGLAFGIRTADCLPLLCFSGKEVALIHAGWRGLACGVIKKALMMMSSLEGLSVLIGPAACRDCYEVGPDVIEALNGSEQATSIPGGKFLLSLAETAVNQILSVTSCAASISVVDVCTIESEKHHSYRREGCPVGSNLCFVVM